jgi:hypothetical protein
MMKPALIRDTCGPGVARSSSPFTGQLLAGDSRNQCAEISVWQFRRTAAPAHSAKPEGLTIYLMVHLNKRTKGNFSVVDFCPEGTAATDRNAPLLQTK